MTDTDRYVKFIWKVSMFCAWVIGLVCGIILTLYALVWWVS